MVENETDLKVKCLGSDNGEKYNPGEFKMFCGLNGIPLERTTLHHSKMGLLRG